jgi:hypothetical protein
MCASRSGTLSCCGLIFSRVFSGWIFSLNWRELGAWGSVFLAGLGGFVGAGLAGFNGGNRSFFCWRRRRRTGERCDWMRGLLEKIW